MEYRAECFLDCFCKIISPCRRLMREMTPQHSQIRHGLLGCNRYAKLIAQNNRAVPCQTAQVPGSGS